MFNGYQSPEDLAQSLSDAGCDDDMIALILLCLQNGNKAESLTQLDKWRTNLLCNIHEEQASIEYVDKLLGALKGQAI